MWWLSWSLAHADEVDVHRRQAELYIKRGFWTDAMTELNIAMETPAGRRDPLLAWAAAEVSWALLDIEQARAMVLRTLVLTEDPDLAEQATLWLQVLEERFGFVSIHSPQPGMTTRLQLECTTTLFDADLKDFVDRSAQALHKRTALPRKVALPEGEYLINDQPVSIAPEAEVTLPLPMRAMGPRGLTALQVTRLEVSVGASTWSGPDVVPLVPSPTLELGIVQPIGSLLVGLGTSWTNQLVQTGGAVVSQPTAFALSGRVSREFVLGSSLSARPGLVLRGGLVPGVQLGCHGVGEDWVCNQGRVSQDQVFTTGTAWGLGPEFLLEHREAGRTTSMGTGVRFGMEQTWGVVPAEGESEGMVWTTEDTRWRGVSYRMLAHLAWAF